MAVIVTDTRLTISDADTAGGWTGAGGSPSSTVFVEAPNAWVGTLNIATGQVYFTDGTPRNVSDTLIYVWSNNFALQGSWDAAQPPNALHIGDGTNRISFRMAGSNRKTFTHLVSPASFVDWDCLVLDGSMASALNTAGRTVARAGSFASLNLSAITQFGADFTTLSKGLGGGTNVAVDIIRIGNDGLRITGGTTGDRGKFIEIVEIDQLTTTGRAHGIIRELTTGLYGCQGPLNFGDPASTSDTYFDDTGVVLTFEDRDIANDKYYLAVFGNASATNFFAVRGSTITTAGPFVRCDFDGGNINTLAITGTTFSALGNPITFSSAADATGHTVTGCSFSGCGQIDPGLVLFRNNTIQASTDPAGSLLIDADGTANMGNLQFVSGGSGHAIRMTAAGEYDFDNIQFSGFAATDGSTGNEALHVAVASGTVIINILNGGDTPSVRTDGATVIINNPRQFIVSNVFPDSEIRIYTDDQNRTELAGVESVSGRLTAFNIPSPGTGYTVDDVLTLSGGVFVTPAQVTVTSVDGGGEITGLSISAQGDYSVPPSNPVTLTGGTGTGAEINATIRGQLTYQFNYSGDTPVIIVVFHLQFNPIWLVGQSLLNQNQNIPVQQITDRVFQG